MDARQARATATAWVETNRAAWPGLRAAHFVGGITTMPDDEPFPVWKDVDLHLIFDDGSPALQAPPFVLNVIEASYGGLAIEAGIKPVAEYQSAATVLGNPEIAHHLLAESLVYDPTGLLRALQDAVRRDYRRQEWVLARIEHERRGVRAALGLREMAGAQFGASGEVNVLGYATTYLAALLSVATLNPPKIGGQMAVRLRETLADLDQLDLYADLLALLGLTAITPAEATAFLDEGASAFDRAVSIRRTPHPFQHKLHPHLRSYFVETCRTMIAAGDHREALGWTTPFICSATDVILTDGTDAEKPRFADLQARLFETLSLATPEERDARFAAAADLSDRFFTLAEALVARDPRIEA